jgi:hypothetical protein
MLLYSPARFWTLFVYCLNLRICTSYYWRLGTWFSLVIMWLYLISKMLLYQCRFWTLCTLCVLRLELEDAYSYYWRSRICISFTARINLTAKKPGSRFNNTVLWSAACFSMEGSTTRCYDQLHVFPWKVQQHGVVVSYMLHVMCTTRCYGVMILWQLWQFNREDKHYTANIGAVLSLYYDTLARWQSRYKTELLGKQQGVRH